MVYRIHLLICAAALLFALTGANAANAQTPPDTIDTESDDVFGIVDSIFDAAYAGVDLSPMQTNIFANRAADWLHDFDWYSEQDTTKDSLVTLQRWQLTYRGLQFAQTSGTPHLPHIDSVTYAYADSLVDSAVAPITALWFDYDRLKPYAADSNLVELVGDSVLQDVTGRPEDPFEVRTLFSAAALQHKPLVSPVTFQLDSALFYTNRSDTAYQVSVDFDDGLGFRNVTLGQSLTASYFTYDDYVMSVRLVSGTDTFYARSRLDIVVPALHGVSEWGSGPDFTWEVRDSKAYGFFGCDSFAVGPAEGRLDKVVIIAEGFDLKNEYNWEHIFETFGFDQIYDLFYENGYDIVILDYGDSHKFINDHAVTLIELIDSVNTEKIGDHPNTIIGASMGGLVARYALLVMEDQNRDHETGLYVSFDSPHQGANIPLGFQKLLQHFNYLSFIPGIRETWQGLTSEAAEQLLIYSEGNKISGAFDDLRQGFANLGNYPKRCRNIAVMSGSGTPTQILANDDSSTVNNHDRILYGDSKYSDLIFEIEFDVWTLPNKTTNKKKVCEIRYKVLKFKKILGVEIPNPIPVTVRVRKRVKDKTPLDVVPGSTWDTGEEFRSSVEDVDGVQMLNVSTNNRDDHSFIPCISALDLNVSNYNYNIAGDPNILDKTPFDAVYFQTTKNYKHIHVNRLSIRELFREEIFQYEFQPRNLYLQNMTITRRTNYEATEGIFMGEDVAPADFPGRPVGDFTVEPGGFVALRAGRVIRFTNRTRLIAGTINEPDVLHAYIDPELLASDKICTQSSFDNARIGRPEEPYEEITEHTRDENDRTPELRLYPNPTTGRTTAEIRIIEPCGDAELRLASLSGLQLGLLDKREIEEASAYHMEFDVAHLPPGVYFVQLRTGCDFVTQKLIIQ